ncbi:phosphatidylglycerophosphatase A family protein [Ligilactobacillus aviarius]|uniref:phosphatidylglycerophosphatase A family protein n=1 Tax=Ligilactobacillus aviarius TaxID=1606 RepID=UPI00195690EC|nr:phosphatidylglycerophosphatase A [Ligilactobacillus aviarius]MBM6862331.1 phosphatidylglycerophosphatase A [Ligilactobacillus aviarius]
MSKDVYPDQEVWNYIQTELEKRDISLNEIATHAWEHQRQFNSELTIDEAEMAVRKVLSKREVRNAIMVALAIDNLANAHQLPEPLQTIIAEDNPCFGVDEMLAINGIAQLYGSIAVSNFGYLDVHKSNAAKKLDTAQKNGGQIATMLDDCISAIQACAEGYLAHNLSASDME